MSNRLQAVERPSPLVPDGRERRIELADSLSALLTILNSRRSVDEILDHVLERVVNVLDSAAGAIYLLDSTDGEPFLRVVAARGMDLDVVATRLRVGVPITGLAVSTLRPVGVNDLTAALPATTAEVTDAHVEDRGSHLVVNRTGGRPAPLELERVRRLARSHPAMLSVPLIAQDEAHGALTLFYPQPREFSDQDVELATAFAGQAALAIQNTSLRIGAEQRAHESDRRRAVAEGLSELLSVVNSGRSLSEILDSALAQARRLLQSDAGAVYLLDDSQTGVLTMHASGGHAGDAFPHELPLDSSVIGAAVTHGRAVVCDVLDAFPPHAELLPATLTEDAGACIRVLRVGGPSLRRRDIVRMRRVGKRYRAMLSVPLMARDKTYGAIALFYAQVRDFADDEVDLARTFANQAALAIQNARLHAESERRLNELQALYRADEQIYGSLRLDEVLNALVDVAVDILRSDKTAVGIWDELGERIVVGASRGFSATTAGESVPAEDAQLLRAFLSRGVVAIEDVSADVRLPASTRRANEREGVRSTMTAPILIGDNVIGAFGLSYCSPRTFSTAERRLLHGLAQRAGLAIQNARLYEQAQRAAALEERQRLARELHDAVTQTLFSAALIAEVLPTVWSSNPTRGGEHLEELRRLTRGAMAEMRTLLVELRPGALSELGLEALLRQIGEATMGRTQIDVTVTVDGQRGEMLAADVKLALYRITQEALNNVVKHAQARQVGIRLVYQADGGTSLHIADDGRGFDPTSIPPGHLGVGIIAERAAAIGATLRLDSRPGQGTRIDVVWPGI
jgi:signal transduction histidine kinase